MINRVFAAALGVLTASTCSGAIAASIDFSLTGDPLSQRWVRERDEPDALQGSSLDLSEDRVTDDDASADIRVGPDPALGEDMRAETAPVVLTD